MITARSNGIIIKRKPFKVLVCLVTLWSFLFNTVSYDLALLSPLGFVGQAWAATPRRGLPSDSSLARPSAPLGTSPEQGRRTRGGTEPSRSTRTPLEPTGVGSNRAVLRQAQDSPEQGRRAGSPDSPGAIIKELSVDTFSLPEYLGRVKDSWSPNSFTLRRGLPSNKGLAQGESLPSVVIHIQDAHCNYYAQHKIAEIITYLNDKYGADTINLEGGANPSYERPYFIL